MKCINNKDVQLNLVLNSAGKEHGGRGENTMP